VAWDASSGIKDDPSATSAGPLGEAAASTLSTLPRPVRRVFSGRRDQIAFARDFVRRKLGNVPVLDEVVLLVSELCTNAVLHTASGDGGTFEVVIYPSSSSVRIAVRDNGSSCVPELSATDALAEDGRGLALVELIADKWGYDGDHQARAVFFDLRWNDVG